MTWKNYSVGEPSLDNQHKKIPALVNGVYDAVERRDDGRPSSRCSRNYRGTP